MNSHFYFMNELYVYIIVQVTLPLDTPSHCLCKLRKDRNLICLVPPYAVLSISLVLDNDQAFCLETLCVDPKQREMRHKTMSLWLSTDFFMAQWGRAGNAVVAPYNP